MLQLDSKKSFLLLLRNLFAHFFMMDFGSFDLQDDGDLFKQNFQLNTDGSSSSSSNQLQDNTDFFHFIGENSAQIHGNLQTHQHPHQHQHQHEQQQQHPHGSYSVPQLSPGGQEGSFTNSSVLSGHNPEFNMSPLQIASHSNSSNNTMIQSYHTPMQHPVQQQQQQQQNMPLEDFQDEEVTIEQSIVAALETDAACLGILHATRIASHGTHLQRPYVSITQRH